MTNGQLQQLSQTSETSSSISSYSSGPPPPAVNGLGTATLGPPARTVDVAISTEDGPRRGWARERAERAMQTEPATEGLAETRRTMRPPELLRDTAIRGQGAREPPGTHPRRTFGHSPKTALLLALSRPRQPITRSQSDLTVAGRHWDAAPPPTGLSCARCPPPESPPTPSIRPSLPAEEKRKKEKPEGQGARGAPPGLHRSKTLVNLFFKGGRATSQSWAPPSQDPPGSERRARAKSPGRPDGDRGTGRGDREPAWHSSPLMGRHTGGERGKGGSPCAHFRPPPACSAVSVSLAVGAVQKFVIRSLKRGNGGAPGGAAGQLLHAPVPARCGAGEGGVPKSGAACVCMPV